MSVSDDVLLCTRVGMNFLLEFKAEGHQQNMPGQASCEICGVVESQEQSAESTPAWRSTQKPKWLDHTPKQDTKSCRMQAD